MKTQSSLLRTFLLSGLLGGISLTQAANVYTAGHGDVGVAYEGPGELFLHGHLGSNAIVDGEPLGGEEEFSPGDFVTVVPSSQKFTGSLPPAFAPTGSSGALWTISQIEVPGTPVLGLATEELDPSDWVGAITFTLTAVTSPSGSGGFSLWSNGAFGDPEFAFSTFDPGATENGDNTLLLSPGVHAHYNFGFTEPGDWTVSLTVSGTHVTDGFVSDFGTFQFTVVPEPGETALLMAGGLGMLALWRRRRKRDGTTRIARASA